MFPGIFAVRACAVGCDWQYFLRAKLKPETDCKLFVFITDLVAFSSHQKENKRMIIPCPFIRIIVLLCVIKLAWIWLFYDSGSTLVFSFGNFVSGIIIIVWMHFNVICFIKLSLVFFLFNFWENLMRVLINEWHMSILYHIWLYGN